MSSKSTVLNRIALSIAMMTAGLACAAYGKPPKSELSLSITMVTGEHSRDSNSATTTLIVSGDTILYEQSYHGAHSAGRTPVKKEYKLTRANRTELTRMLRTRNLLVNRTLSTLAEQDAPGRYFELKIRSKLNGKEYSISIEGPRSSAKLKQDRIYQDSVYLIEQLYKIINMTDPDVSMPELIN